MVTTWAALLKRKLPVNSTVSALPLCRCAGANQPKRPMLKLVPVIGGELMCAFNGSGLAYDRVIGFRMKAETM